MKKRAITLKPLKPILFLELWCRLPFHYFQLHDSKHVRIFMHFVILPQSHAGVTDGAELSRFVAIKNNEREAVIGTVWPDKL